MYVIVTHISKKYYLKDKLNFVGRKNYVNVLQAVPQNGRILG